MVRKLAKATTITNNINFIQRGEFDKKEMEENEQRNISKIRIFSR